MSPANNRILLATVGGVLHSILLNWWEFSYLGGSGPGPRTTLLTQVGAWTSWVIGPFLLGAIPIYLYLEHKLVLPSILTVLLTAYCFADRLPGGSMEDFTAFYFGVWPFFLTIILLAGGIEYYPRHS